LPVPAAGCPECLAWPEAWVAGCRGDRPRRRPPGHPAGRVRNAGLAGFAGWLGSPGSPGWLGSPGRPAWLGSPGWPGRPAWPEGSARLPLPGCLLVRLARLVQAARLAPLSWVEPLGSRYRSRLGSRRTGLIGVHSLPSRTSSRLDQVLVLRDSSILRSGSSTWFRSGATLASAVRASDTRSLGECLLRAGQRRC